MDRRSKPPAEELKCTRCGDPAKLLHTMLEPITGKNVRLYECKCGERMWDD